MTFITKQFTIKLYSEIKKHELLRLSQSTEEEHGSSSRKSSCCPSTGPVTVCFLGSLSHETGSAWKERPF